MGTDAFWVLWISSVALWGLGIGGTALNGITHVVTGGPGYLPFERWLRKRTPATHDDFVLQGTAQILQAFSLTLIAAPISFVGLLATTELTTGWHPPSPPEVPVLVGFAVLGSYMGSLVLGMFCAVWAFIIGSRVKYVRLDGEVRKSVAS